MYDIYALSPQCIVWQCQQFHSHNSNNSGESDHLILLLKLDDLLHKLYVNSIFVVFIEITGKINYSKKNHFSNSNNNRPAKHIHGTNQKYNGQHNGTNRRTWARNFASQ